MNNQPTVEIEITGASDDLIEIEGVISEEFNWYPKDGERGYLAISDGTLMEVRYDNDGIWRFRRLIAGSAEFIHSSGSVQADTNDVVRLRGIGDQIQWVLFGGNKAILKHLA